MQRWLKGFLFLFLFGLLLYSNSLNNKFLMDDYRFLQNPYWSSTKFMATQWSPYGPQALGGIDQFDLNAYYRPLAHIVLDLSYDTFKAHFWKYHLLNILLFVFAASLIYLLVARISQNYLLAFWTSLFYLIHPINGIVVNYISGSILALQVIFMLGTILLLWESLERGNDRTLYFLSLLCSFLSLFWNESGIMIVFYVCAVILLFRKDPFKAKISYGIPYFLIICFYILFRIFFVSTNELMMKNPSIFHMISWDYPASLFQIFGWYITQLFYPRHIVMEWIPPGFHEHVFWNSLGAISLLLVFLLLFIRFSKEKICQLAIAWIMIGFAPACVAAFRRPDAGVLIEPHWFIFSCIGFFILFAYFLLKFLDRMKRCGLAVLFLVIFAWGSASYAYNQLWSDQKTYARFWSQQAPSLKMTYFYLAAAYQKEKAFKESRKYYRLALNGYSSDITIYNNLGMMDEEIGNWQGAELNYRKALGIDPYSAGAYDNLGSLYIKQGQWGKAGKYFIQALNYNPLLVEPRAGLAYISLRNSDYQKAIDLCLKNLDLADQDTNTLFLLVDIYIHKNDLVNVNKYAYRIINHETDPGTLMKLGVALARHSIMNTALDSYKKILQVAPDYKDAYYEAGLLYERSGQYDQAVQVWKMGAGIDPADQRFKSSIARAKTLKST